MKQEQDLVAAINAERKFLAEPSEVTGVAYMHAAMIAVGNNAIDEVTYQKALAKVREWHVTQTQCSGEWERLLQLAALK